MDNAGLADIDTTLIDALLIPEAYPHPVADVSMIETHISWVLLAGDYAYKIKKPVELGFLDFRELDRRRHYCEEEVRLNRLWAPEIYLGVVPIVTREGQPRLDGSGEPVEYAVKMRRFEDSARLDIQLDSGALTAADMKELGQKIAARHEAAARVGQDERERLVRVTKDLMWDNFTPLSGTIDEHTLEQLRDWTAAELGRLESTLWQRVDSGFVRECHGDLHLRNLLRLPSGITAFDCIEFSADLRNIDVMCDIAFLTMDLVSRERHDLAGHLINRYLECTGDYDGVDLLSLYFVYRCLVRAKVEAIRSTELAGDDERAAALAETGRYCRMACRQISRRTPVLVVMTGLSGSGKTFVSGQLMAALPAIRIRSDVERKRLFGLRETERSGSGISRGIYTPEADRAVYERLFDLASRVLASGHNTILDASFLKRSGRARARELALRCGATFVLVETCAPHDVLRERLAARQQSRRDASEAGQDVLEHQIAHAEPVSDEERRSTVTAESRCAIDDIVARINAIRRR